jgi:hypothetical protein
MDVETLFGRERWCVILRCKLVFGAVDRHDVSGGCVLWMFWRVILEFA